VEETRKREKPMGLAGRGNGVVGNGKAYRSIFGTNLVIDELWSRLEMIWEWIRRREWWVKLKEEAAVWAAERIQIPGAIATGQFLESGSMRKRRMPRVAEDG
jgi:hypothetical protein